MEPKFIESVADELKLRLDAERAQREALERSLAEAVIRVDLLDASLAHAQRESTEQLETIRVLKAALRDGRRAPGVL